MLSEMVGTKITGDLIDPAPEVALFAKVVSIFQHPDEDLLCEICIRLLSVNIIESRT